MLLIEDICAIESTGLKEYAVADKGREAIITSLRDVLAELPDQTSANVSDDTIFMPELNSTEREDLGKREQTFAALRDQSAQLLKYEKDIAILGEDFDLWMDGNDTGREEKYVKSGTGGALTAQVRFHVGVVILLVDVLWESPVLTKIFLLVLMCL